MLYKNTVSALVILSLKCSTYVCIHWDTIKCAADTDQHVPEGKVPDIGRFPWLGIIQHSFYIGGKTRFAVTSGILVHPAYVIAPADDIAKILPEQITNNTKFIVWHSESIKYSIDVKDFGLHPEYQDKMTFASIAIIELAPWGETGISNFATPVLPICLPIKGSGVLEDLYAIRIADVAGEIEKQAYRMNYVPPQDCEEFYYRAQLNFKMMKPVSSLCAVSQLDAEPCIWEGGVVLVTRQSWGYWRLLGFGVRGPGCGAPARFVNIQPYLLWMDGIISRIPEEELDEDVQALYLRSVSPHKIIIYSAKKKIPKEIGQCDRKERGNVLFKDSSELLMTKNFGQGFYFVSVYQVAEFTCASLIIETISRSQTSMWLEHHCTQDLEMKDLGFSEHPDYRRLECFIYFKTVAFLEFRFYFSFKATFEMTIYGKAEIQKRLPNPFKTTETTYPWWPTRQIIRWGYFVPYYVWWYWM